MVKDSNVSTTTGWPRLMHHARANIKKVCRAMDDAQQALATVQQLRSRGVSLAEIDSDHRQDDPEGDVMEDSDLEMAPSRQRPRLALPPASTADQEPKEQQTHGRQDQPAAAESQATWTWFLSQVKSQLNSLSNSKQNGHS